MIEDAVLNGSYVGILATTASAGPAEEAKIASEAPVKSSAIHPQIAIVYLPRSLIIKTEIAINTEAMRDTKVLHLQNYIRLQKIQDWELLTELYKTKRISKAKERTQSV